LKDSLEFRPQHILSEGLKGAGKRHPGGLLVNQAFPGFRPDFVETVHFVGRHQNKPFD
jgi:hypothetical protein